MSPKGLPVRSIDYYVFDERIIAESLTEQKSSLGVQVTAYPEVIAKKCGYFRIGDNPTGT